MAVAGAVDLATIPVLRDALVRAVARHPGELVAVDLDGVSVLDDTGLGILLGSAGRARENGGDVGLVASDRRIRSRLGACGLDRAVAVADSVAGLLTARR